MIERIAFDKSKHRYSMAGVRIPSVTEALKSSGLINTDWFNEDARELGEFAHSATAYLDQGRLDLATVDDDIKGYLNAYVNFQAESGFTPDLIEKVVYHPTFGYAGTLDRTGKLNGRKVLIDLKTGVKQKWWGYQTAAYWEAYKLMTNGKEKATRFSLQLKVDGKYNLVPYTDQKNDFKVFLASLTIHNAKG